MAFLSLHEKVIVILRPLKIKTMIKSLRLKIFASFMLLVLLLAVAGFISITEFRKLTKSVHGLMDDNYKSIEAAKRMLGALEREDSGVLLWLLGEDNTGKQIVDSADFIFRAALREAKNNITEANEEPLLEKISLTYKTFLDKCRDFNNLNSAEEKLLWYKNDVHREFLATKKLVDELMDLNQASMYKRSSMLKEKSKRAMMPGIVSIISALVFSLILNFFISNYFVRPITTLSNAVSSLREGDRKLKCNITSNDEIKKLEQSINQMLLNLSNQKNNTTDS